MEPTYDYTPDELRLLGEAIVWTSILAAVHQDGVIQRTERAEAIKQAHIRSFHASDYLRPIYEHLDSHFERDFDKFSSLLPEGQDAMEAFIASRLAESLSMLEALGGAFTQKFNADLRDFYYRIFRVESNAFQFFAFPILSAHLEKFGIH